MGVGAELAGFKTAISLDVHLEVGQEATLDVALQVGSLAENVTVKGGPIVVDRTHFFASAEITRGAAVATVSAYSEKGDVAQPFRGENVFGKIEHQPIARPASACTTRARQTDPRCHSRRAGRSIRQGLLP